MPFYLEYENNLDWYNSYRGYCKIVNFIFSSLEAIILLILPS
jgi:hypothetical protein